MFLWPSQRWVHQDFDVLSQIRGRGRNLMVVREHEVHPLLIITDVGGGRAADVDLDMFPGLCE